MAKENFKKATYDELSECIEQQLARIASIREQAEDSADKMTALPKRKWWIPCKCHRRNRPDDC